MRTRHKGRVDANQSEIVKALRKIPGLRVRSTAEIGDGFPDIVVGFKKRLALFEIKDPSKAPSQRRLTEKEQEFFNEWEGLPVYVIETAEQVLTLMGSTND